MGRNRSANKTQECAACGGTFPTNGHGLFAKHACTHAGRSAVGVDPSWVACPAHGHLVWVLGPYSSYPRCVHADCTMGEHGKPWRYHVSRSYQAPASKPDSDSPKSPPIPTSTPAPVQQETHVMADTQTTPAPAPSRQPYPDGHAMALDFAKAETQLRALGSLGDAIQTYIEGRAMEISVETSLNVVSKLVDERGPVCVEWKVNGAPLAKIEGKHHVALPRLLKLYAAGFRNFLIVGPAGSGKTTLARQFAESLALAFAGVSVTSGMSESALTGRAIPNLSTGETAYQSTDFVRLYETGGVFLLDEVDAADPNVMLAVNSALANGHMPLPNRVVEPAAERHADSVIICAANTWGTGADRQYVGRNQLDAAFLDRFVGTTIEVSYDRELESALSGDPHICARVWEIRGKVESLKLRRVVGTRFLLSLTRLVKCAGETLDEGLRACTVGWTDDERSKVGVRS